MKKRLTAMVLALATIFSLCVFNVSAADDTGIMPLSSIPVNWGPVTISKTSQWVTSGAKGSTDETSDVYFSSSLYPYGSTIEIRIYDYTSGRVVSSWNKYNPYVSGSYYLAKASLTNASIVAGHTYVLNLRWPDGSTISSASLSGIFYP